MVREPLPKTKSGQEESGAREALKPEQPKKRSQPFIIRAWCKNCGICAAFCPKGVLRCDDTGANVEKPEQCTGCRFCEMHCPDLAVSVQERDAAPEGKLSCPNG